MDIQQMFTNDILAFNLVVTSEILALPLGGDFSWVPKLKAFNEEYERLDLELDNLLEINEAEYDPIWIKKRNGDPTWMDDVKRILAEQEPES
jgi:hypothetical protein